MCGVRNAHSGGAGGGQEGRWAALSPLHRWPACPALPFPPLQQGLFRSFDEAVRRQLAPIWHTVPPKTKQLVGDLRTLRGLALYMLRFDAVTFVSYLENLRATEGVKSVWLFHPGTCAVDAAAAAAAAAGAAAGGGISRPPAAASPQQPAFQGGGRQTPPGRLQVLIPDASR